MKIDAGVRKTSLASFEVLDQAQCAALLIDAPFGRVGLAGQGVPTAVAVKLRTLGRRVRFAADPAAGPVPAPDEEVVLGIDHLDPADSWSVAVMGRAVPVPGPASGLRWFDVNVSSISGRRLRAASPRPRREANAVVLPPAGPVTGAAALRLLATEEVGRLAVALGAHPRLFPVNYAVDGDAVVFRTNTGTKLHAVSRSLVAFEVDRFSEAGEGWSVVIEGVAQEITSAEPHAVRARVAALAVEPWAPGERPYFVRIQPFRIRGYSHRWG